MTDKPWEHPDWYDLHDTTWTAGPEREPEHYREMMLALPPLDAHDHLIDAGAGTGKLAALIATSYPRLGRVTLIEPNEDKLERARLRLEKLLPNVRALASGLGENCALPKSEATIVSIGSVLMPVMELRGGTLSDGLRWLQASLADIAAMLKPGAWVYAIETLAAPWARGSLDDPVRRLNMLEFAEEFERASFQSIECVYRFRDRVALRAKAG
ncbi:MAG: class I SAM-dependent methyltransferase [Acidobacteriota bacterium]